MNFLAETDFGDLCNFFSFDSGLSSMVVAVAVGKKVGRGFDLVWMAAAALVMGDSGRGWKWVWIGDFGRDLSLRPPV